MKNDETLRYSCLDLASRFGDKDHTAAETVARAQAFFTFLVGRTADDTKITRVRTKRKAK